MVYDMGHNNGVEGGEKVEWLRRVAGVEGLEGCRTLRGVRGG